MPETITGVVARPPVGGAFADHADRWTRLLASSIESTTPTERERAVHWLLLGLMLIGATIVRFWGLDSVGLHGDEETMAMAVRGILEHGAPLLPSGMFYPRGLTQLALMSLSVSIFGESEWALRLPSALCGIVLVALGYFAGRRFLRPTWAVALAAALAFLPELVMYSQTARMYVFLVTFIATAMVCVFQWERTGRAGWLIGAIVTLIFGLEMHSLAIASVLMLLFPGVVHGDVRKLGIGVLAMLAVSVGFITIETFVNAQYPDPPSDLFGSASATPGGASVTDPLSSSLQVGFWAAGLVLVYCAARIAKTLSSVRASLLALSLLIAGAALQIALFYHLAALCYAIGITAAARLGSASTWRALVVFVVGVGLIAMAHALALAPAAGTIVRLAGAMNGQPSAWPYVRIAEFSVGAALLCAALLGWGLYRIARSLAVADYWLIALLGVWAPVFALGMFAWNVPPRYTAMSVLPMVICAFAFAQMLYDRSSRRVRALGTSTMNALGAGASALLVANPMAVAATIDAGYRIYPDHKGAAEFMRSQGIVEDDVVLAEDVLQQTYYLGRVDYWLIGPGVARRFVMKTEQGIVDFYTGTPVVVTTEMLDKVLKDNHGKRIFVIGTGEGWERGRRSVRGELEAAIESDRFETVYTGRDGVTRVLRATPAATKTVPPAAPRSQEQTQAELTKSAEEAIEEAAAQAEQANP